jgi:RNA polymerase sigma-70 factor (ECF subfamily)
MLSINPTFMPEERCDVPSLLEDAREGDAEAFGEVCRAFETRLLRQAVSLCGDLSLAEDLTQETLVEAWRCLRRYNGKCQFFTWLCSILLNRYRNTLRNRHPTPFSACSDEESSDYSGPAGQLTDPQALPDQAVELRDQAILVQKCIQVLSRKHQQVIYLRFYVDDSLESIAAALGCSIGTVKSRLFHALEKLRAMKTVHQHFEACRPPKGSHETV